MKWRLFISLILFFTTDVLIYAQHYEPVTAKEYNLYGNPKSVKKTSWFVDPKDSINVKKGSIYRGSHERDDFTILFDSSGREIQYRLMDSEKERESHIRDFIYDSLGRIIEERTRSPIKIYRYDSLSRLISITWPEGYRGKPVPDVDTFIYDEKNLLIEKMRIYNYSGEIQKSGIRYKYDEKGRSIKESGFYGPKPSGITEIKYSIVNGMQKTTHISLNGGEGSGYFYTITDSLGRKVEEGAKRNYNRGQMELIVTYYTYDDKNNILTKKSYKKEELISSSRNEYKYDATGNWIRKIIYEEGIPHCIHERAIIYY